MHEFYSKLCIHVLLVFGLCALVGCADQSDPAAPAGQPHSASGRHLAAARGGNSTASWSMPDPVWSVVQQQCAWCHTPQHPLAGIDFSQRYLTTAQVQLFGQGVQLEMAPLIALLSATDKRTLLDWAQQVAGTLPPVPIPQTFHWELAPLLAPLADGAAVPGFAFVVEDGYIDTTGWKVATYTDKYGISFKSVSLNQTHSIDRSIFPPSSNPASYFFFKGIPWHGRFYDSRLEGDVRVNRWISVGMETNLLHPTGRSNRGYIRLQFDRDSMCMRSTPTGYETWPWGGSGSSPGTDGRLTGNLNASGFYQSASEWLHFVFTSQSVTGGVNWTAVITRRGTGATVASLQGFEAQASPLTGTFFLHAYAVGDKRNWANLVFDAKVDGASPPGPVPAPSSTQDPLPPMPPVPVVDR